IPDESVLYHAERNDFSNWIMARSEIGLASSFRDVRCSDFDTADGLRHYIISNILDLRKWRQKGVVTQFNADHFDPHVQDFVKIGDGSLGGKGRGLAFMSSFLQENREIYEKHPKINILIPKTLVLATDCFETFVKENDLRCFADDGFTDQQVRDGFLNAQMPEWLGEQLKAFLSQVHTPLAVRSSSLLEDAQFQPYAGLYQTCMIPNNNPDLLLRLKHLIRAIKMVYASTYYEGPKAFSKSTSNKPQEEAMAVIIEQIAGDSYGEYFYPAISGVAQTHNFYPVSYMKPEEGIVHIALGFGKTVVEGEKNLRFSPKYPGILPQFSTVDDILANSQRFFYALKIRNSPEQLCFTGDSNLEKREIDEAEKEFPVISLASTYIPEDHRIRDTAHIKGPKVLSFAPVLKYNLLPLPDLLCDILELGRKSMGTSVEIEFAVNLSDGKDKNSEFYFLQMRPMVADENRYDVQISKEELENAFCISSQALGNGKNETIADIVYVKPDDFKLESTVQMVQEIDRINAGLVAEKRPYLLIGPGRWGSADRFLGIPVQWRNISGVAAIIELRNEQLQADPSQGSHFFQNITSLGIHYLTVSEGAEDDRLDWNWLNSLSAINETTFLRHVRLDKALVLKINGRESRGLLIVDC
ncbi:MAG: phosphoenolpyruvate synthase/pyruvate phosphate dikinase, partial [Bacteroidetes bacterium]|nr:phosphoenolpyruvate synthase/pyruvate phosphate dikinase [Bacteroidota bacterium]